MSISTDNYSDLASSIGLNSSKDVAEKSKTSLGQEDFLSLMTTQLKHQDPFKPMESGEFLGQMAQFSTVSGISELQKSFSSLASSLYSNQALQASSLVGRSALVPGSTVTLENPAQLQGAIELPSSVNDLTVSITGPGGELVNRYALGVQGAGLLDFQWDGRASDGSTVPAGSYSISAEATVNGAQTALQTYVQSTIGSINLDKGNGISLNLVGLGSVPLEQVKQVRA